MIGKSGLRDEPCIYAGCRKAGGNGNYSHTRGSYLSQARERIMQLDWRAICGPALATATALIAIGADRTLVTVPNPAPLFVCIVALAASLSGLASGIGSAAIAVTSSALFFLNLRATPGYDASDLVRLAMLALTAAGTA